MVKTYSKSIWWFSMVVVVMSLSLCACAVISRNALKDNTAQLKDTTSALIKATCSLETAKDSIITPTLNVSVLSDEVLADVKQMVTLHIEKVDNDYTVITIWAAVLSIIFLVFSFYSIYKIEETKQAMNDLYEQNKKSALKQLDEFNVQVAAKQKEITEQTAALDSALKSSQTDINMAVGNCKAQFTRALNDKKAEFDVKLAELTSLIANLKNDQHE